MPGPPEIFATRSSLESSFKEPSMAANSSRTVSATPLSLSSLAEQLLAQAQAEREIVQDFCPLAGSLELGQQYLHDRGDKAFISNASLVPFVVNNDKHPFLQCRRGVLRLPPRSGQGWHGRTRHFRPGAGHRRRSHDANRHGGTDVEPGGATAAGGISAVSNIYRRGQACRPGGRLVDMAAVKCLRKPSSRSIARTGCIRTL